MILSILKFKTCLLFILIPFIPSETCAQTNERMEFFRKIQRLAKGQAKLFAEETVGSPDIVWTREDHGTKDNPNIAEVWCYGMQDDFPTLGRIVFDHHGKIYEVFGDEGRPFQSKDVKESQVRELLAKLHSLPNINEKNHDPFVFLNCANDFQGLGQALSFDLFREYARVAENQRKTDGIALLLRTLHEIPEDPGYLPSLKIGAVSPKPPSDLKICPRFPLIIIDDVPLCLLHGYSFTGGKIPVDFIVEEFEGKVKWRQTPIEINKKEPSELFNELLDYRNSKNWFISKENEHATFRLLKDQLSRYVNSRKKLNLPLRYREP